MRRMLSVRSQAWELMHLVAATMPPSKDFVSYVSEYIHDCAHDPQQPTEVRAVAIKAWGSLKRCAKAGPRRTVPTQEEIEALRSNRSLNTIVFFLDETFEELNYDITTTVLEVRLHPDMLGLPATSNLATNFMEEADA